MSFAELDGAVFYGPNDLADTSVVVVTPSRPGIGPADGEALATALNKCSIGIDPAAPAAAASWASQIAFLLAAIVKHCAVPGLSIEAKADGSSVAIVGEDTDLARLCLDGADLLFRHARRKEGAVDQGLIDAWQRLKQRIQETLPDLQALGIAEACRSLGLPHCRYSARPIYHHIGEGSRRMLMDLTDTSLTAHLAVRLAGDKTATNRILAANGLPVARQMAANSPAQAWQAARRVGLPAVVKPQNGNQSRGVTIGVRTEAEAAAAFDVAQTVSERVIVESYIPGADYRIIVSGERVIGALEKSRASVVGDGARSIRALVDQFNVRIAALAPAVAPIKLDGSAEKLLAADGMSFDAIPPPGKRVLLSLKSGMRVGGIPLDVSDRLHPDNADMAVCAAGLIGLDVTGIDFRTPDITRPWTEVGGGICEVNSRTGILAFMIGKPGWLRDTLMPAVVGSAPRRIPHVLLVGGDGDTGGLDDFARLLGARLGARFGWRTALALAAGLELDGYAVAAQAMPLLRAYRRAIENPLIDAAIYCCTPALVAASGFGLDRVDLAVVPPCVGGPVDGQWRQIERHIARCKATLLAPPDSANLDAIAGRLAASHG